MQHKRVRTDNFLSDTNLLRVTGRSGYETSTDLWIEQDYNVTAAPLAVAVEEERDLGFHINKLEYNVRAIDRVNVPGLLHSDGLVPGVLNLSMPNIRFKPMGSGNHYDCFPEMQRKILPYLVADVDIACLLYTSDAADE